MTPLRRDPCHNLFCQAWGTKQFSLYPAGDDFDDAVMDVFPRESLLRNTSRIDLEDRLADAISPKHEKFYENASKKGVRVLLRPGEILFMPRGTWHFVKARSACFSVSYWW